MDKPTSGRAAHLVKLNRENSPRRKYTFDEHYFDAIDTPEKAYWLGLHRRGRLHLGRRPRCRLGSERPRPSP